MCILEAPSAGPFLFLAHPPRPLSDLSIAKSANLETNRIFKPGTRHALEIGRSQQATRQTR